MAAEIKILGPDGQPIRRDTLAKEIAFASLTGVRTIWNQSSMASGLSPDRLARILRNADEGEHRDYLTLAEEMEERDPHYASVLGTRKRAVSSLEITVEAASDDKGDQNIADGVRNLIRHPGFGDMLDDCMDAIGKGYSVLEMMWDRSGSQWWVKEYIWRDPRFFRLDRVTGRELRLIDEADLFNGIPLAPYKFITHMPRLKSGLPIRGGVARLAAAAYMCKAYAVTDWLAFSEVFGMPLRVGRYGPNATEGDIRTLINAVANIGSDAAAVIPDSMKVEFQENGTSSGGNEIFEKLATWIDKQVSKAVLGQTMTADDGSSNSQAQVHNDVRGDIQASDARQLENTINRDLIRAFVDLNYGPQKQYPRVRIIVREAEDIKALSESLAKLVPLGLKVEQSVVRDKLGLPDPAAGADLLVPPGAPDAGAAPVAAAANRQQACTHCGIAHNNLQAAVDPIDQLEDDASSDWHPQLAPIVDPVVALAERCGSYEEFLAKLPTLLDEIAPDQLVKYLASATFKARALGNSGQ